MIREHWNSLLTALSKIPCPSVLLVLYVNAFIFIYLLLFFKYVSAIFYDFCGVLLIVCNIIRLNTCGFFSIWLLVQITSLKMGHTSKCFVLSK